MDIDARFKEFSIGVSSIPQGNTSLFAEHSCILLYLVTLGECRLKDILPIVESI